MGEAVATGAVTIGVVEDSVDDFRTFTRVFAGDEQFVRWPDGESCLNDLRARGVSGFDVLVVDLGLPGIPGVEVIRAIRAMPGGPHAAIFVLSGSPDPSTMSAALAAGADECFTKPNTIAGMRGIAAQIADVCD